MSGNSGLYYWDACLFLAWLKDEERKSGEMDGVREAIQRCKRREIKLVTSVLTTVEVLTAKMPVGLDTLFYGLLKRINKVGVDSKVAGLAHDLRNFYVLRADEYENKTLCTPDAIHLATAIIFRADEFHTFDEKGTNRSLGLIPLSGNVGGHALKVCKPEAKNPTLDLRRA